MQLPAGQRDRAQSVADRERVWRFDEDGHYASGLELLRVITPTGRLAGPGAGRTRAHRGGAMSSRAPCLLTGHSSRGKIFFLSGRARVSTSTLSL